MDDEEYEVGYGKPPQAHRFQKGTSGNPKGRPKKDPKTVHDQIMAELQRRITVNENGKQRKVTKAYALAANFINSAAKGDHKSLQLLFKNFPLY